MDLVKACTVTLKSASPYSQSRNFTKDEVPLAFDKETIGDYDERTWRHKMHVNDDGIVCIPGMALKQAIDAAAKRLAISVPGKGKATYTKHFLAGIILDDLVPIGIRREDLTLDRIYVNADGIRGSGKRVWRNFPSAPSWTAKVTFHIIDAAIPTEVFERVLREAGVFVGIGRFRPEKGGTNGRFKVTKLSWSERPIEALLAA